MAIIKTKIKEKNYLQIDKTAIEDNRLSWSATGLLTYLIGKPKDWNIVMEHLKNVKTNGRDATRNTLNELRKYNYCHFFQIKKKGVIVDTIYLVFEYPISPEEAIKEIELGIDETVHFQKYKESKKKVNTIKKNSIEKSVENKVLLPETENPFMDNPVTKKPLTENPFTDKPYTEEPLTENPTLLIIDTTNNRNTNNRTTTNEKNKKKKDSSSFTRDSLEKDEIKKKLENYNLNSNTIENIIKLYETSINTFNLDKINDILNYAKEKSWGDGAIYSALKNNWSTKNILPVINEKDIREKIKNIVNYYIAVFENGNVDFEVVKNKLLSKIDEVKFISDFEDLRNEYLKKFDNYCKEKGYTSKNITEKDDTIYIFDNLISDEKIKIEKIAVKKYLIEFPGVNLKFLKKMSSEMYKNILKPYIKEVLSEKNIVQYKEL